MRQQRILAVVWPTLRAEGRFADPRLRARFGEMLDRLDELSPRVESPGFGVAVVDVTGLGALVGDEARVARRAAELVSEVEPLPLLMGAGDNRWVASVAARCARPGDATSRNEAFERIPPGEGRRYLAPLPIAILPADGAARSRFTLFGLTRVGQLGDLSRSAVGTQFGAAGERLHALARGEDARPLVPRRRPERVIAELPFEPPIEGLEPVVFAVRRCCAELCETLRGRHRASGRAVVEIAFEGARSGAVHAVEVTLPHPVLEPDWIARLLVSRLDATLQRDRASLPPGDGGADRRITLLRLVLDRLSDPWTRQLPAFEPQAGRWEELRWSLERIRSRFGAGRLWRAVHDRPYASLAERQARLVDIGLEADAT